MNLILSVATEAGSVHDFKILKQSLLWSQPLIQQAQNQEFDLGFQGVQDYLPQAKLPHKKTKNQSLTKSQKQENRALAKTRVKIENINREVKIFRICKETRRHKQKKHHLFWTLIAGVVNFKRNY